MKAPTSNPITQGRHGSFNAVDYASAPDVNFYAPEDGVISSVVPNNGDCGNSMKLKGATGEHGFCHIEEYYVGNGQSVVAGQRLAKMGYTGLTVPKGPSGRHLHWILNRGGQWVYPPDYINESPNKEDEMVLNDGDAVNLFRALNDGRQPSAGEIAAYVDWSKNNKDQLLYETIIRRVSQLAEAAKSATPATPLAPGHYIVK